MNEFKAALADVAYRFQLPPFVVDELIQLAEKAARCSGAKASREDLLRRGYKTDSWCTWLAIGRCAECGRVHDGKPHDMPRK